MSHRVLALLAALFTCAGCVAPERAPIDDAALDAFPLVAATTSDVRGSNTTDPGIGAGSVAGSGAVPGVRLGPLRGAALVALDCSDGHGRGTSDLAGAAPPVPHTGEVGARPKQMTEEEFDGPRMTDRGTLHPTERWSSFLPMYRFLAEDRGYELPLPIGVSFGYMYLSRDIEVNDIDVRINEGDWRNVDFVDVEANSRVKAKIGRLDMWLLPFLNVYGFYGNLSNDSGAKLSADLPFGLPTLNLSGRGRLRGDLKGWGVTMAGGWKEWFAMGDVNRAHSNLDGPDEIDAWLLSLRTGWNGKIFDYPVRLWVGGMWWDTARVIEGEINLPGLRPDRQIKIEFEVGQGPVTPYSLILGGQAEITDEWHFAAEFHYLSDVFMATGNLIYRF